MVVLLGRPWRIATAATAPVTPPPSLIGPPSPSGDCNSASANFLSSRRDSRVPTPNPAIPPTKRPNPSPPTVQNHTSSPAQGRRTRIKSRIRAMSKRKQPDSGFPADSLSQNERILYSVIHSKQDMGIWTRDMKKETNLPDKVFNPTLKTLQAKKVIQEVVNVQSKGRKHYIAAEFEPSKELTGGAWYSEWKLDKDYISLVKDQFAKMIYQHKVATLEGIADAIRKTKIFKTEFTKQQTEEIVRDLVLDSRVVEVKSTGMGEFASVQIGKVCYKCKSKGGTRGETKAGAMASIPCGVCPRIVNAHRMALFPHRPASTSQNGWIIF